MQGRYSRPLTDGEIARVLGVMLVTVIFTMAVLEAWLGRVQLISHGIILGGLILLGLVLAQPLIRR